MIANTINIVASKKGDEHQPTLKYK